MALKDTAKKMKDLLESIQQDLTKAEKGNKAAAQRVRTDSIKLEKVAKVYRKESIRAEKSGLMKRKPAAKPTKSKKAAPKKNTKCAGKPKKAAPKKVVKNTRAKVKVKKVTKSRSLRK